MIKDFSPKEIDGFSFKTRLIGSIIIAFSGILLYSDKILALCGIESDVMFGFTSFSNFVWVLTQSIAPIIMILGSFFNPFRYAYSIAIYCYLVQIIWIFSPEHSDDFLIMAYAAIGLVIILIGLVFLIKKVILTLNRKKNKDQEFINDAKDVLALLKAKVLETHTTQSV